VHEIGALGQRLVRLQQRRQRLPGDGKIVEIAHGVGLADHRGHRLALEARFAFGEHRLVGHRRDDAETVAPRNVAGAHHIDDARVPPPEPVDVAELESAPDDAGCGSP
jgi:hypothetical protein